MAAARSSLEGQVVSIMRSLRERGRLERVARRLEAGGADRLERVPGLRHIAVIPGTQRPDADPPGRLARRAPG